jgi:asparagine synthase (glutamine-hydrolysing)
MSGFLLASSAEFDSRWAEALGFSPDSQISRLDWGPWTVAAVRVDDAALWAPAHDPERGLSIVLGGRLSLDATTWHRARNLPGTGGLAGRYLIDAWLTDADGFGNRINGGCCILLWEAQRQRLHLWTDRMGVFPVYAPAAGRPLLCSHPDVLADALSATGRPQPLDMVTLAECLVTGSGVAPYTYYEGIRQLQPASHYLIGGEDGIKQAAAYWQPKRDLAAPVERHALAEELALTLKTVGARRQEALLGRNGLLLSGGADSRALLFAADHPERVETLTFCDAENPEAATARAIAAAAGANHRLLVRDAEHYAEGTWESVRISGGMWCMKDAHYHGFLNSLRPLGLGNLMTGCYADYLLKGLSYNRNPVRLLGKPLPLETLAPFGMEFYQPFSRLAPKWTAAVDRRLAERFPAGLQSTYTGDPWPVEDKRVRPLSREPDAMGRLYLLRMLPWDPVMVDNEIVDFYVRIPPQLKLNARVFRDAVTRLLPAAARSIPNNNDRVALDMPEWQRVLYDLAVKARRRLSAGQTDSIVTEGSWPNFNFYLSHSLRIEELWRQPTAGIRSMLTDLLGEDPWATPLAAWARRDGDLMLRLITMKVWLTQRGV